MTATNPVVLPGRLGTPDMELRDDPRADPRMVAAMAALGMDGRPEPVGVDGNSPIEHLLELCLGAEPGYTMMSDVIFADLPPVEGVTSRTEVIEGADGNDIKLYIHQPADMDGPIPAIVHTHGGGMVILTAADVNYVRWRDELAATGMVVIGVEFRNGGGALGNHPFPAGLNDCASAAQWAAANKDELGISHIVMSGESGGGNLAIATTMKAKKEGWLDEIAGVYAQCPYISNAYTNPIPSLPSLVENDGYFLDVSMMGGLARVYSPTGEDDTNPLAWPMHASTDDVAGLPPHVISVNQLDPLRDEGLAFFQTLLAAGVPAISRTVNGTVHAGDCIFRAAMPDVYAATIADIRRFADSVA